MPTVELKAKMEADLEKRWVWVGKKGRKGCMGWTKWIEKEAFRKDKLEI